MGLKFGSVDSTSPPSSAGTSSDHQSTSMSGGNQPPKPTMGQTMKFGDVSVESDSQQRNMSNKNGTSSNSNNQPKANVGGVPPSAPAGGVHPPPPAQSPSTSTPTNGSNSNTNSPQPAHPAVPQHGMGPPPPPQQQQQQQQQYGYYGNMRPNQHGAPHQMNVPGQMGGVPMYYGYYPMSPYTQMAPGMNYAGTPPNVPANLHHAPQQQQPPQQQQQQQQQQHAQQRTPTQGATTPQKAAIKLSDPKTHQPIDLPSTRSQASTPTSSMASPRPASSPLPGAATISSPTKSPSKPAPTQEKRAEVKNEFMLKIQERMKAEREQKEKETKPEEPKEELKQEVKEEAKEEQEAPKEEFKEEEKEDLKEEPKEEPKEELEEVKEEAAKEESAAAAAGKKSTNGLTQMLNRAIESYKPTPKEVGFFMYPEDAYLSAFRSPKKYKYDPQFLMQFQKWVDFPPRENWEDVIKVIAVSKSGGGDKGHGKNFGSRSNSVRGGPQSQSAMGSFGSNGGMGFRMDRNASSMGPNGPGFNNHKLNRMQSSSNLNSMGKRQGSKPRRGGGPGGGGGDRSNSKRKGDAEEEEKPFVPPPPRSANAWVPRTRKEKKEGDAAPSEENRLTPEEVQRKVKSSLNKMTLDNFEKISDQIIEIAAQSKYERDGRTLRQVIELTFAKAVDEQHWSNMYAQFCAKIWQKVDKDIEDENIKDKDGNLVKGGQLFRKYLLNRCQEEFEKGWSDKLPTNPDGSTIEDPELMSEEYYAAVAAKRRGLGLIRFIGELFILQLLSERIIHVCINKLLSGDEPSEEAIESLSKLMTTTGAMLDSTAKGRGYMNMYFESIKQIQSKPSLPSRLRFMLMDVADLRAANWRARDGDKGPQKISDIKDEQAKKQAEQEARQQQQRGGRGGHGHGHGHGGGGGGYRSGSNYNSQMAGDLSKLGRIRSQGGDRGQLGPSGPLMNRDLSGSGRRSGGYNSPATPLSKEPSRSASQQSTASNSNNNTRANIFEHLNENDDHSSSSAPTAATPAPSAGAGAGTASASASTTTTTTSTTASAPATAEASEPAPEKAADDKKDE